MRIPLPDLAVDAEAPASDLSASTIRPGANRWFVALLSLGGLVLAIFATVQVLRVLGFDASTAFRSAR